MNKRVLWGLFGAAALSFGIYQLYGVLVKKAVFSPEKAQDIIRQQATAIAPVKTVTCPAKGAMKKNDTVTCNLTFADGTAVGVVLTAMNDKYDFQLSFAEPITSAEFFETIITDGIKEQANVDATVECGAGVVKAPTITCTATDPAGVKVTILGNVDKSGGGTWNVQNAPTTPTTPTTPTAPTTPTSTTTPPSTTTPTTPPSTTTPTTPPSTTTPTTPTPPTPSTPPPTTPPPPATTTP